MRAASQSTPAGRTRTKKRKNSSLLRPPGFQRRAKSSKVYGRTREHPGRQIGGEGRAINAQAWRATPHSKNTSTEQKIRKFPLSLALTLALLMAAPAGLVAQPAPVENAAEAATRDLKQQEANLGDRSATAALRDEAARRLVSRSSPEADDILLRALADFSNKEAQLAVARALSADTTPNPAFIEPLCNLLGGGLTEPAAQALSVYKANDQVRDRLIQFVNNLSQQQGPRIACIRAIGKLVDRKAAGALVGLLNSDTNSVIRDSAADALVEMTGLNTNGRDAQRWNQWWQVNRNKSDSQWSSDLLLKNASRVNELSKRIDALRDVAAQMVREEYRRRPDAERAKFLLGLLQAPSEDVRVVAVQIVYEDVVVAKPVPPEVFELLRGMIGDSAADVRKRVARTLTAAASPGAVDALLTQLAQERDPDARAAIALALGPSRELRVVEPLLLLLDDESFSVARSAADSLKELASTLREEKNAEIARQVAWRLRGRLRGTEGNISAVPLRQSLVDAMAQLAQPSPVQLHTFYELIKPDRETAVVRISALRGLGLIGNPDSANMIVNALSDPDANVRLEAVGALQRTATFAHVEAMGRLLSASIEPDQRVRDRVWDVLAGNEQAQRPGLLAKGSPKELNRWAERFKSDTDQDRQRRLIVLSILEKQLIEAEQQQDLAYARLRIGETLLVMSRPDEAATRLQQALDHFNSANSPPAVTDLPNQQLMQALLQARKYGEAVRFATDIIAKAPENTQNMWLKIRQEAQRLKDARDLDGALALLTEAKKIPLGQLYTVQLRNMEDEYRRERSSGGQIWFRQYTDLQPPLLPTRLTVLSIA